MPRQSIFAILSQRYEKSSAEQKNLVLFYAETKNLRHAVAKIGKKLRHDEDLHNLFYSGMKKSGSIPSHERSQSEIELFLSPEQPPERAQRPIAKLHL